MSLYDIHRNKVCKYIKVRISVLDKFFFSCLHFIFAKEQKTLKIFREILT
jgi:hypothetical protein